jgi:hypothetical protein
MIFPAHPVTTPTPIASFYALMLDADYVTAHLMKVEAYAAEQLLALLLALIPGGWPSPLRALVLPPDPLIRVMADNGMPLDDDECIDLWLLTQQNRNRWHLWGDAHGTRRQQRTNLAARVLLGDLGETQSYVGNLLLVPAGIAELLGAEIAQEGQQ